MNFGSRESSTNNWKTLGSRPNWKAMMIIDFKSKNISAHKRSSGSKKFADGASKRSKLLCLFAKRKAVKVN